MTDTTSLRRLGLNLGIESYEIDTDISDHKDEISLAAYSILKKWRRYQETMEEAYTNMYKALIAADMKHLTEILS